jgi:hypothetical protein
MDAAAIDRARARRGDLKSAKKPAPRSSLFAVADRAL